MSKDAFTVFRSSIARRGLWGTLALIPKNIVYALRPQRHFTDREFDLQYGTDTSENAGLGSLTIKGSNAAAGNEYRAIFRRRFREVMSGIRVRHEDYVFVDIGSGKGKALLLASDYPFKRIIGVEFAHELHDAALRNIAIYQSPSQRCRDLVAVCEDAIGYVFPGEPTILFVNNPFGPPVLGPMLTNFRASLATHPRPVVLAYVNPVHGDFLRRELEGVLVPCSANDNFHLLATPDVRESVGVAG